MKFEIFGYTISIEQKAFKDEDLPQDLREALAVLEKYGYKPDVSPRKTEAARHATQVRQNRVKEKIQNAINLLRLEGKEITPYRVAKAANVSYNTARKYLNKKTQ